MVNHKCSECEKTIMGKPYRHREINDWNKFCSENCLSLYYFGEVCQKCQIKTDRIKQGVCKGCFDKNQPQSSQEIWAEIEAMMEKMKKDTAEINQNSSPIPNSPSSEPKKTTPPPLINSNDNKNKEKNNSNHETKEPLKEDDNKDKNTNETNSTKEQTTKNEAIKLLEKVKELENILAHLLAEEVIRKRTQHVKSLIEELKQTQINNTSAYKLINNQENRIDKLIINAENKLTEQQPKIDNKPKQTDYAPWIIGGGVIVSLFTVWLLIKKMRSCQRLKKIK